MKISHIHHALGVGKQLSDKDASKIKRHLLTLNLGSENDVTRFQSYDSQTQSIVKVQLASIVMNECDAYASKRWAVDIHALGCIVGSPALTMTVCSVI